MRCDTASLLLIFESFPWNLLVCMLIHTYIITMTNSLSLPLSLFIDILLQYTMLDFANYIRDEIGSKAPIVHKPATQDDPQRRRPDITRAKALLGYDVDTSREYIYIYIYIV